MDASPPFFWEAVGHKHGLMLHRKIMWRDRYSATGCSPALQAVDSKQAENLSVGKTKSYGSCPILVIVEREVLYTAYGHHVGEVKHVRHATGSHACTTLTRTAWPSRRPRRRGGTPGVRPKPPAGATCSYAALTSAGA